MWIPRITRFSFFLAAALTVVLSGARAQEFDTDRVGSDFHSFWLNQPDYRICARACNNDGRCRAWTYVRPGVQGSQAKCWLKNRVPRRTANNCCVSGVKGGSGGGQVQRAGYLGCFRDQGAPRGTRGRDLSGELIWDDALTVGRCVSACRARGYRYAGVQWSKACFCGNAYGRSGPANNCNMRCAGDGRQTCGGTWANSVYSTGASGGATGGGPRRFKSRWDQVGGNWTTGWQYNHTGQFCGHGEPHCRACPGAQNGCGRYANGRTITVTPYGVRGDCGTKWQLRCTSVPQ